MKGCNCRSVGVPGYVQAGSCLDLEEKLEGELHGSGAALLILRSHCTEACIQHLGSLAERRIGKRWINESKVRVIEEIEGFGSKLQDKRIMQMKVPSSSQIELGCPEAAHEIARGISGSSGGWQTESGLVDSFSARNL